MNHSHLRVDFDPHVNFIVGKNGANYPNRGACLISYLGDRCRTSPHRCYHPSPLVVTGSGKSAIVNALIAGFGHRANTTGKNTNSAKSLIKNGKDYALIQMHLANGGEDAYKPEEFGDTIVAEHRIERNGPGTYRLRDGLDGVSRKSSKREFEDLCSHMNIQADNPCALLTQEHAKKFLHGGNEEDRYRFFLQAANLESRKSDLGQTEAHVLTLTDRVNRAKEGMVEKEAIAAKATAEYAGARKLKDIQKQLDDFDPMLGWAIIGEKERELQAQETAVEEAAAKEEEARSGTYGADADRKAMEEELAQLEREQEKKQKETDAHVKKATTFRETAKKVQKEMKRAKKDAEELAIQLEDATTDEQSYAEEYRKATAAMQSTISTNKMKEIEECNALEAQLEETNERMEKLTRAISDHKSVYQAAITAWQEKKDQRETMIAEIKSHDTELNELKKTVFSRERALHPSMPSLLELIQRSAKRFRSLPVGPLGLKIAVRDEYNALSPAIQQALGGVPSMLSFVVTCHEDEKLLRELAAKVKAPANVHKRNHLDSLIRVMKVDERRPRYKLLGKRGADAPPSLLDVLDITASDGEADIIWNLLCDMCRAETRLLFDSLEAAEAHMYRGKSNCEGFVCPAFGDKGRKLFFKGTTQGNEYLNPVRDFLVQDKAAMMQQVARALEVAKQRVAVLEAEVRTADAARKQAYQTELDTRKELKEKGELREQIDDTLTKIRSESVEDAAHSELNMLNGVWREAKNKVASYQRELEEQRQRVESLEAKFEPLKQANDANSAKYDELMAALEEAQERVAQAKQPLIKMRSSMAKRRKDLESAEKERAAAEKQAAELKAYIEKTIPAVEDLYGERVDDPQGRTTEQLKAHKLKLEKDKARAEARHGNATLEELAMRATEATRVLEEKKLEIETVESIGRKEAEAFYQRAKFYKKEAKLRGQQAAGDFNRRLSKKNHAGDLCFDHDHETLSLQVTRNNQDVTSSAT